jgi:hypothetical protein
MARINKKGTGINKRKEQDGEDFKDKQERNRDKQEKGIGWGGFQG